MKQYEVVNSGVSNGVFNGVEFRETLVKGSYVGAGTVPEDKIDWFKERPWIFQIGDGVEVETPAAANAIADQTDQVTALKGELETTKIAAANAIADLQGHLDQIAVLTGAEAGTMDAIAEALKTFRLKK
jgi:hypothetical protein